MTNNAPKSIRGKIDRNMAVDSTYCWQLRANDVMHCNIFGAGDVAEGLAGCCFCPRSSRTLSFVFREILAGADISVASTTARLLNRRHARLA